MNPTMNRRVFLELALAAGAAAAGWISRLTHSQKAAAEPVSAEWQALNPANPPPAREGHTMVALSNGKVLLFGGKDAVQNLYNDLYTCDSGQWAPVSPANTPPAERMNHSAWFMNGKMHIHGGVGKNSQHLDDLWTYDPQKREWVAVEVSGGKPSARKYHAAAPHSSGGAVLIAGGIDANNFSLDDVWLFANNSFTLLGGLQQSVATPQAHWIDDGLWLLGDGNGKVVTYNLLDNTSAVREGGPPVMSCASALWESPEGKLVFVFGGRKKFPPPKARSSMYTMSGQESPLYARS